MSFINKPKVAHPSLPRNELGLTRRDYEGGMSTLCAGCGHDSVTAAIIEACWQMSMRPEKLAKLSGIGCSSKTTAYFVSGGHGFNSVHGRMPSIATGAVACESRPVLHRRLRRRRHAVDRLRASSRTRSAAISTCCT
jgi:2-oxoglutarate ferredoxin oxidoreductase subunit beta